ncbi:PAS domain S-box protein [Luteolibacter pohnpeiensis]|uniref:PAS domain S-box protein n=1 Tax=Luteolibacter pohnpeiensis TaxID=454153 RepID=A0A934S210_9BACT|nr:chemotaxis protein CheB [Luteolibacter pohnpeiensis]MBK1880946.1 PAS domain S-box protein [Luteolibacter pohnpeiensis]
MAINSEQNDESLHSSWKGSRAQLAFPETTHPARFDRNLTVSIVGIGGSEGGLLPLQELLSTLETPTGLTFIVVAHGAFEAECPFVEGLRRFTAMPVRLVKDSAVLEPDHVYVVPAGSYVSIKNDLLQVNDMKWPEGSHMTLDLFFRALADAHRHRSVAIVLSGAQDDGSIGLKRIKERGGLTICQDPSEAEHARMPRAAIATGMVDRVVKVADMPDLLLKFKQGQNELYTADRIGKGADHDFASSDGNDDVIWRILMYLKDRIGLEFSRCKQHHIRQRVSRRIWLNKAQDGLAYLEMLKQRPAETTALLRDLLVGFTNYFNAEEFIRSLEIQIPGMIENHSGRTIRVWVPACYTGEEAYTVAMLLSGHAAKLEQPPSIQVFATDLDQAALNFAREGRYMEMPGLDFCAEQIQQYFERCNNGFRVKKSIRDMVLFARHDLFIEPPFSQMDLISCYDLVLGYVEGPSEQIMAILRNALRLGGKLIPHSKTDEFAESMNREAIRMERDTHSFSRCEEINQGGMNAQASRNNFPILCETTGVSENGATEYQSVDGLMNSPHAENSLTPDIIEQLTPPIMIIGPDYRIVNRSKKAIKFLQRKSGRESGNLLQDIRPEIRANLAEALHRAEQTEKKLILSNAEYYENGNRIWIEIAVHPTQPAMKGFRLVAFRELGAALTAWPSVEFVQPMISSQIGRPTQTAEPCQQQNHEITEKQTRQIRSLKSANKQIASANRELKKKLDDLKRNNIELKNLMASTKIAKLFLDTKLRVSRSTPSSTGIFDFPQSDIGRPFCELTHQLEYPEIHSDAAHVLRSLSLIEREARDLRGHWFLVRLFPYRTTEDLIAGVVITCVDITERKKAEEAHRWLSAIVESSNDAIFSFNMDGKIISWNRGAERIFGYTAEETVGREQSILAPKQYQAELIDMLEKLRDGEAIDQFQTIRRCKNGKLIDVSLSAAVMRNEAGEIVAATAIAQDVTERNQAVRDLEKARDELEHRVEERTAELQRRVRQLGKMAAELTFAEQRERKRMAHVLHDGLQQMLVAAKMRAESLNMQCPGDRSPEVTSLVELMDEALACSRSLAIELSPPILSEGLPKALEWLCKIWLMDRYHLKVDLHLDMSLDAEGENLRNLIFLSVKELLFNVVKHSGVLEATVDLYKVGESELCVLVQDYGVGFQTGATGLKSRAASGFGLLGLRERLEMLGGAFKIERNRSRGVKATITAPRAKSFQ